MKTKLIILIIFSLFISIQVYSGSSEKEFDLSVKVPEQFSYISLIFNNPIGSYTSAYKQGFVEALENYKYKEKMEPIKMNGRGVTISGHHDGFMNALAQLREFEKDMSEKEIRDLIESNIGEEAYR